MRQVLYSVAMSLDGYIARPQGEFDWIPMDPAIDWGAFMSHFDVLRQWAWVGARLRSPGVGLPSVEQSSGLIQLLATRATPEAAGLAIWHQPRTLQNRMKYPIIEECCDCLARKAVPLPYCLIG